MPSISLSFTVQYEQVVRTVEGKSYCLTIISFACIYMWPIERERGKEEEEDVGRFASHSYHVSSSFSSFFVCVRLPTTGMQSKHRA